MSFKTLMLPLSGGETTEAEYKCAGDLAAHFDAKLIGITAREHLPAAYFEAGITPTDPIEEDRRRLRGEMVRLDMRFRAALEPRGIRLEWRSEIVWPLDFVIREARAADLLVMFARPVGAGPLEIDPGALVLGAGRPLLLIRDAAKWRVPERMLVVWKDTREARRAVADALPFLTRAKAVRVVEIVEGEESIAVARARTRDVSSWLSLHGVKATAFARRPQKSVMTDIDTEAADFEADLVVAGAYGHTRIGEWIFGGVTRHLMTRAKFPVLLSH